MNTYTATVKYPSGNLLNVTRTAKTEDEAKELIEAAVGRGQIIDWFQVQE